MIMFYTYISVSYVYRIVSYVIVCIFFFRVQSIYKYHIMSIWTIRGIKISVDCFTGNDNNKKQTVLHTLTGEYVLHRDSICF